MLLVTGANGLLGARCIERYAGVCEQEVVAVWHSKQERLLPAAPVHVHYQRCDLTDKSEVETLFNRWKIERVLHAAALLPDDERGYFARAVRANVAATANLAECARDHGCTRFVYCSSASVYDGASCRADGWQENDPVRPSGHYAWTKFAGEECVRLCVGERGVHGVVLRLAGIHGPGRTGGAVFRMIRAAQAGGALSVSNPKNRFQLLFVDDAVDAVIAALQRPMSAPYLCINVASHLVPSLNDLAERIVAVCGSQSSIEVGSDDASEHVMDTTSMTSILAVHPPHIDTRLRQTSESVHGRR